MAVAQLPLLTDVAVQRIPAYVGSAAATLGLGAAAVVLGASRFGPDAMGLTWPGLETVSVWTAVLLATAGLLLAGFWAAGRIWDVHESPVLRDLLPRTARERRVFAALSFCAGTGEELAYRGYAMLMIIALTGSPVVALFLANVPFALVHVYQGRVGLVRTYLLGLALGGSFLATTSLWPAMVAHTLIDLVGGLVLGDRLLGPGPESVGA